MLFFWVTVLRKIRKYVSRHVALWIILRIFVPAMRCALLIWVDTLLSFQLPCPNWALFFTTCYQESMVGHLTQQSVVLELKRGLRSDRET